MAAPNIVGVTTIVGFTTAINLTSANPTVLVSNAAGSGAVLKINNLTLSNITNSTVGYATVRTHTEAAGLGVSFSLSSNIGIATGTSLVLMDKASSIYVEEGRSITVQVNPINTIHATCSYERIQ